MAIAFQGAAVVSSGAVTTSISGSYTVNASSNCLVVCLVSNLNRNADDITSMTYAGTAMTLLAKSLNFSQYSYAYYYYLLNPSTGANTLAVTSASSHWLAFMGADYSGVDTVSQPDVSTTNLSAANGTSLTTSLTSTVDNDWMILCHWSEFKSGNTPTAGTGSTRRCTDSFGIGAIFDSNGAISPAGSNSMTTTIASADSNYVITHIAAMMKPAAVAPDYVPPRRAGSVLVNRSIFV